MYIHVSMCIYTHKLVCMYDTWAFTRVCIKRYMHMNMGFPSGTDSKESACNVGAPGSIPGSGRSPGGGLGNPLQYPSLENSTDRGAWWAGCSPWGRRESAVTKGLARMNEYL